MIPRKVQPFIVIDCNLERHKRFQALSDLDRGIGVWTRCLAWSREAEEDGRVAKGWVARTWGLDAPIILELVHVGLLLDPGPHADHFVLHAYAPRNQTKVQIDAQREKWKAKKRGQRVAADSLPLPHVEFDSASSEMSPGDTPGTSICKSLSGSGSSSSEEEQAPGHTSAPSPPESGTYAVAPPKDLGLFECELSVFAEGVRAVNGTCIPPPWSHGIGLRSAVREHWPGLQGQELLDRIRAMAMQFAGEHNPTYGGFTVRTFARWLDDTKGGTVRLGARAGLQRAAPESERCWKAGGQEF